MSGRGSPDPEGSLSHSVRSSGGRPDDTRPHGRCPVAIGNLEGKVFSRLERRIAGTAGSSRVYWYDPRFILSRASLILSTGSVTVMRMYPSADSPNPDPGVTMTPRSIIFCVNSNDDIPQSNHT